MKFIPNWKRVALKAHSMWAFYASLVCLLLPEVLFVAFWVDTNPRLWWILAAILLSYGILGRLVDQKINQTKIRSPWPVVGLVAVGLIFLFLSSSPRSVPDWPETNWTAEEPGAKVVTGVQDFLTVAVPFIGRWEGLRLEAYLDIVGVPTVCYGETKGVKLGDTYTKAECDAMLAREILSYRDRLHPAFTAKTIDLRLPVARHVAFVSLAYNVGVSGTSKSTAVRRLNASDIKGACDALGWWNKAGGRVIRGLANRRAEETSLCMRGVA